MWLAYVMAIFLIGVLVGVFLGTWYGIKETRREYEERMRLVRRYLRTSGPEQNPVREAQSGDRGRQGPDSSLQDRTGGQR